MGRSLVGLDALCCCCLRVVSKEGIISSGSSSGMDKNFWIGNEEGCLRFVSLSVCLCWQSLSHTIAPRFIEECFISLQGVKHFFANLEIEFRPKFLTDHRRRRLKISSWRVFRSSSPSLLLSCRPTTTSAFTFLLRLRVYLDVCPLNWSYCHAVFDPSSQNFSQERSKGWPGPFLT